MNVKSNYSGYELAFRRPRVALGVAFEVEDAFLAVLSGFAVLLDRVTRLLAGFAWVSGFVAGVVCDLAAAVVAPCARPRPRFAGAGSIAWAGAEICACLPDALD